MSINSMWYVAKEHGEWLVLDDWRNFNGIVARVPSKEVAELIVKEHNAGVVMRERGWGVIKVDDEWSAVESTGQRIMVWQRAMVRDIPLPSVLSWPDPFAAILEANTWYIANIDPKEPT
jgi:hypothetical protein